MLVEQIRICVAAVSFRIQAQGWIALIGFTAILHTGCGNQTPSASVDAAGSSETTVAVAKTISSSTKSVLPDTQAIETSPAAVNETDPRAVCRRFLELLQSNNRIAAENLLTQTALQVTGKAGLVLEPLSGPNSQFDVDVPRFATIKNEIAYVDCRITDLDQKTDNTFSVSWIVKKQASGWRIAGLVMDVDEDRPRKMFSFENPQDVADIKLRAAVTLVGDESTKDSERQANLSTTETESTIK